MSKQKGQQLSCLGRVWIRKLPGQGDQAVAGEGLCGGALRHQKKRIHFQGMGYVCCNRTDSVSDSVSDTFSGCPPACSTFEGGP